MPASAPRLALALVLLVLASACASRSTFRPPLGVGVPDDALARSYEAATSHCTGVQALTAEVSVSGRVDGRRVRAKLHVGTTREGRLRIEGLAPFGAPAFVFVSPSQGQGDLWLPRSREWVHGNPNEILEVLTGVDLRPDAVFRILTACPRAEETLRVVERFDDHGLARGAHNTPALVFFRVDATPIRPLAVHFEGNVLAVYEGFDGTQPRRIHLSAQVSASLGEPIPSRRADIRLTVSQAERVDALPASAFVLDIPGAAEPTRITLRELAERLR